jgi:diguanylate cyclase (GGDEF)-like protein
VWQRLSHTTWDPTAHDDGHELHTWQTVLAIRHVAVVALCVIALAAARDRTLTAFAVLACVPYQALLQLWTWRTKRPVSAALVIGDHALAAIALLIVPAASAVSPLIAVTAVAHAATVSVRRTYVALALSGPILIATSAIAGHQTIVVIPIYCLSATVIPYLVSRVGHDKREERDRYRALLDGVDALVWESPPGRLAGHLVTGNTDRILGYSPDQWAARRHWADHIHMSDRERVLKELARGEDAGGIFELSYRMVDAAGKTVHIPDHVRCERDSWGTVYRLRGVMLDITKQLETENKNRRYGTIVEHLPIGIVVLRATSAGASDETGTELVVVDANSNALTLLRRNRSDVIDRTAESLLGNRREIAADLLGVLETGEPMRVDRTAFVQQGGDLVLSWHAFRLAADAIGVIIEDVTDQAVAAAALRHQALHDALTGLPNRSLLMERLRHALADARRGQTQCALLVMDLDQFKEINDTLGHDHGDRLLIALADRLRLSLRECDTIARLGGDEFALLLDDATLGGAMSVAEKVLSCAFAPFDFEGLSLQTGASVGVALFPDHATDPETLLKRADIAMYTAKRSGGGVTVYEVEHDRSSLHRLTLVGDLRHAIEQDELRVVYQPIADLQTGVVEQIEALTRWAHPRHGVVPPTEFIPLAEVSGAIKPLTRWMMDKALSELVDWRARGVPLMVSINLSMRNLYEPTLVKDIAEALRANDLPGSSLAFELTERELMDDASLAHEVIDQFHALGVRTIIDDFGTGYSSLSFLQTLPIHGIKIDRSFVGQMGAGDSGAETIVRSIIDLGRNLGLEVVAVGVQSADLHQRLDEMGCTKAQGFHIGRPMTANELTQWLGSDRIGR